MGIEGSVLAFVMAGGRGSRLKVLTKDTCKPAVNILGTHKIFDFVATVLITALLKREKRYCRA